MAAENLNSESTPESWCVILQSYPAKKKKDIAKRLAEVFELESKDADAAISSTPLILLDGLSFPTAGKIKEFFRNSGAVVEMTNHDMIKKNCYQIVWSTRPNLSFFEVNETPKAVVPTPPPLPVPLPTPTSSNSSPSSVPTASPAATPPAKKSVFDRFRDADKKKQEEKTSVVPAPVSISSGEVTAKEFAEQMKKMEEKKPVADIVPDAAHQLPTPVISPVKQETAKVDAGVPNASHAKDVDALKTRIAELDRHARELEVIVGQKENRIKDLEKALGGAQATEVESVARIAKLQQRISELEKGLESKYADQAGAQSVLEGQNLRIAELDRVLADKIREADGLNRSLQDIRARESDLSQRADALVRNVEEKDRLLSEKNREADDLRRALQELQTKDSELNLRVDSLGRNVEEKDRLLSEKNRETEELRLALQGLQTKDADLTQQIESLGRGIEEKDRNLSERYQEIEGLKRALQGLQANETGSAQRVNSLAQSIEELNRALRHNEDELKGRDERIAILEQKNAALTAQIQDFERIRQEHERLSAERDLIRQEYDAKFSEQAIHFAKIDEESRRYRSRTERKNAAATRELGEWIRGIESLRQGLQKLIHFIGSDAAIQDPDKTTLRVGGAHRTPKPQENEPQS